MAKKKNELDDTDSIKFDTDAKIKKLYGNVIRPANEIMDRKLEVFSSGSANLDFALGGGIEEGSLVELAGLPKIGKTSLTLQAAAGFINRGRRVYFCDAENRFNRKNLQIDGLDANKLTLIRSDDDKILDANDTFNLIETIMKNEPGSCIILDSASALCSKERATSESDAQRRDTRPKLWADFLSGVSALIRVNRITFFVIRHMRVNQEKGKKWVTDAGYKLDYRMDVSLHCTWSERWEEKPDEYTGKILHMEVLASNFKAPVEKVDVYLRFGHGIDSQKESVQQAIEYGLVSKGGSWLSLDYLETPIKLQGEGKVTQFLKDNPESYELLRTKIKELFV